MNQANRFNCLSIWSLLDICEESSEDVQLLNHSRSIICDESFSKSIIIYLPNLK